MLPKHLRCQTNLVEFYASSSSVQGRSALCPLCTGMCHVLSCLVLGPATGHILPTVAGSTNPEDEERPMRASTEHQRPTSKGAGVNLAGLGFF